VGGDDLDNFPLHHRNLSRSNGSLSSTSRRSLINCSSLVASLCEHRSIRRILVISTFGLLYSCGLYHFIKDNPDIVIASQPPSL
jgi:hypothetical protein